jgi:hypothetical protein
VEWYGMMVVNGVHVYPMFKKEKVMDYVGTLSWNLLRKIWTEPRRTSARRAGCLEAKKTVLLWQLATCKSI